jgi:hypothetical protein
MLSHSIGITLIIDPNALRTIGLNDPLPLISPDMNIKQIICPIILFDFGADWAWFQIVFDFLFEGAELAVVGGGVRGGFLMLKEVGVAEVVIQFVLDGIELPRGGGRGRECVFLDCAHVSLSVDYSWGNG